MFKRLTYFSIKSFIGPFIVTFAISMFILIMQFTWKYIDDLMGKGLGFMLITEFMFYVSASLIPLALPLAILLSSIMTMGNLAENNELTALKSSGLSLFRILRPLTFVACLIGILTFLFMNYTIPVVNLKWHSMIYDIQNTKVSILVTPGSYSKEIDNLAIKVKTANDNTLTGITLHDYSEPNVHKTVKADSGILYKVDNGNTLLLQLFKGKVYEELNTSPPIFAGKNDLIKPNTNYRPNRRTSFKMATYKIDLSGFNMEKSDENLFKNDYEMLNVFQISDAKDSLAKEFRKQCKIYETNAKNTRAFFHSKVYKLPKINGKSSGPEIQVIPAKTIRIEDLSKEDKIQAIDQAISSFYNLNQNGYSNNQQMIRKNYIGQFNMYEIEFHRKFALAFTIIVLFFVGAPLGAIVKIGGIGAPVLIAALLFLLYFVLFTLGESLANDEVVSPFFGMWMPAIVLAPIAFLLFVSAANDLKITERNYWKLIFSFGRKR
ncbi:MAG: LptF/LptG family permease [Fluviicola sp.]